MTLIGASIKRVEDYRLLTGGGRFVADLRRPGAVSAVIVRSPHAHARLVRVDARAAQAHPGVLACLTFADFIPSPGVIPIRMAGRPELNRYLQTPLASGDVCLASKGLPADVFGECVVRVDLFKLPPNPARVLELAQMT